MNKSGPASKPPLCICDGPVPQRDPGAWMWGSEGGGYFYYREICPVHGHDFRKKLENHDKIMRSDS